MKTETSAAGTGNEATATPIPYGFFPWWFWNDDLQPDEMRRQVAEMADKGMKGFYIAPRQGLRQPYLSDAFFERVELAIELATEHGLVVHFCDENPYPSGAAGGEATEGNPEYFGTRLDQLTYDVDGGPVSLVLPRGRILCCRAYPLTATDDVDWTAERDLLDAVGMVLSDESYNEGGLTSYNRKRYFASNPTPTLDTKLPPGRWRLLVSVQGVVQSHKYWGHFIDVLNPDAMRHFIRVTHDRYAARVGQHFGTRLLSIFVDETRPGWSARLPEHSRAAYGYELLDALPALQDRSHPRHVRVARDLQDLKYALFCDTFERPMRDWCADHGLRYGGEKPSVRLAQLRFMDLPGCDPGHTKAGAPMDLLGSTNRSNARATASAAYFYGKEGAICECYHSLGWSATLQDAKTIAEGLLLMGIRCLLPHGFFYSTHALRKHDAPPSFFYQMPYWPLFDRLAGRIDALGGHFEGTHIAARVLVVDPSPGLPTPEDLAAYAGLQQVLMEEHIDFLTVDTDILQGGDVKQGAVKIRDICATVVILPPMQDVEAELDGWLSSFEGSGGQVVRCASTMDADTLRGSILDMVQPSLALEAEAGDARPVQMVTRRNGDNRLWFLLNTGAAPVLLRFTTDRELREEPLDDGAPASLQRVDGGFRRELQAFESVLLTATPENSTPAAGSTTETRPDLVIEVGGPCRVTPLQPNVLRMGEWDMCLVDEQGHEGPAARVAAIPLANQLSKAGLPFPPVFEERFGRTARLGLPRLHVRYRAAFESDYGGAIALVMEPGSIVGDWTLAVNGDPITPEDLKAADAFVPGCLGCDITSLVKPGDNTIAVDVVTDRVDGGLLNPLYLTGEFGVLHEGARLIARPEDGNFDDYESNALPFFSGVIDYEKSIELSNPPVGDAVVSIQFDCPFEDACEVSFNGGPFLPLPWSPRRVLVPAGQLRDGKNDLRIRVYTSMIRTFEGERFDIEAHSGRPIG